MHLIFGFLNGGGWDNYLRAIQSDADSVVVPLLRGWQEKANGLRNHAETHIRVKKSKKN
jgi:hypothetical protein